jgi:hypothetical protein
MWKANEKTTTLLLFVDRLFKNCLLKHVTERKLEGRI